MLVIRTCRSPFPCFFTLSNPTDNAKKLTGRQLWLLSSPNLAMIDALRYQQTDVSKQFRYIVLGSREDSGVSSRCPPPRRMLRSWTMR